jgi:signal transduction histidine kinase
MHSSTERALLDKIESLSLLRQLNDRLADAGDFVSACQVLVDLLWEEGGGHPAAFFSIDATNHRARLEAYAPGHPGGSSATGFRLDAAPFVTVLEHTTPTLLTGPLPANWPGGVGGPSAAWLGVPLRVRQDPIGVLCIRASSDHGRRADDARLLAIVATSAALALDVSRDGERAEFVAMLRHDIANPLSTALGYAELLMDQFADDPAGAPTVAVLDTIREQLRAISELVTNYLHIAAIDRGAPVVHWEDVDLRRLIGDIQAALALSARDKGLTLECTVEHDSVRADRRHLHRVLMNLVSNAIKYTPGPGQVSVTVRRDGEQVAIAVRDSGLGIAPEHHPRVFTKYARFHTERGIPGTGLGLYLSRGLIEAHGGTLALVSAPGEGSTFCVRLRLDTAA